MDFKTIGLSTAVAAAVVASSVLALAPAQAATLSGSVTISGQTTFSTVGSTTTLNFLNQKVSLAFGDFSSLVNKSITVTSLTLVKGSTPSVNSFIDFGTFTKGSTTSNLSFVLNPNTFTTLGLQSLGFAGGKFDGFFKFGDNTVANGSLSAFSFGDPTLSGSQISLATTAVPTPALLPGLLAMGLGLLRKRRVEAIAAVDAEA